MPDWKKLTKDAASAATLDEAALRTYLTQEQRGPDDQTALERLVKSQRVGGFMATSAPAGEASSAPVGVGGDTVGIWKLDSLLGRGGMGEVWRALRNDGLFDQIVALKLMRPGDERRTERFDLERRRLALMEHAGVARIVDGGVTDSGVPFMAMEYVDGVAIDAHVRGRPRSEILGLFADLCDAVHHAHGKFVLHRDIKADNVLVDAAGQVRLIDFGISSAMEDEEAGGPLTLATAAPEQLIGTPPVSVATDVFALGMLLHQLLTRELPERRSDASVEINREAIGSAELSSVLSRATTQSQNDRYSSADALALDVRNWMAKRPVLNHEGGLTYRFGKFLQRFPLASAMGAAFLVALIGGLGTSLWFSNEARNQALIAETARNEAISERDKAQYFLEKTESTLATRSAYSDALTRLTEASIDADALADSLITRAEQAHEFREADPERAAQLSYAIGVNLMDQGNHPEGRRIIERWLEHGHGDQKIRLLGRTMYARSLVWTGEIPRAMELFRELDQEIIGTLDEFDINHRYIIVQIALGTRDPDAIQRATDVLEQALESEIDDQERFTILGNLALLQDRFGQFDEAYGSLSEAFEIRQRNPLLELTGRDAIRLQISRYEIFYNQNFSRADEILSQVLNEARARRAKNVEAQALGYVAEIELAEGNVQRARQTMEESIAIFDAITRNADPTDVAFMAELVAYTGDPEEAFQMIQPFYPPPEAVARGASPHPRVVIAEANIAGVTGGAEATSAVLAEAGLTRQLLTSNLYGAYLVMRMEENGVVIP